MYASFLGISEALHMDIFHQPLRNRFFDSLSGRSPPSCGGYPNLKDSNILVFSNKRVKALDGLSGVLGRCQKPCFLYRVSSTDSLAPTPAHTGRPNRDQAKFNAHSTGRSELSRLCAILKSNGQIFWPLSRMPISPGAFQTSRVLQKVKRLYPLTRDLLSIIHNCITLNKGFFDRLGQHDECKP